MSIDKNVSFPFISWLRALKGHYNHKDIGGFKKSDWMANIDGKKYLNELSIPGSHDTCALYEPLRQLAQCQNYTVCDQLNMGVRYLDLRVNVVKSNLVISHGPIFQGITFDQVMEQCYYFLSKNPSEAVIVSLKHELIARDKNNEFNTLFLKRLSCHRKEWFIENRIPQLSEVRGKLVLLNRVKDLGIGINASENWIHNGTSMIEHDGFRLHIQDKFKIETLEEAWELAKNHFQSLTKESNGKKVLSINFHSGVFGYPHVKKVANYVNDYFLKFDLGKLSHLGVAVFDFITPEICNRVISANS